MSLERRTVKAAVRWVAWAVLCSLSASAIPAPPAPHPQDTEAATSDPRCPRQLHRRSTEQVLEDHLVALQSGNAALIACDYAREAVLLFANSAAVVGREQIEATFAGLLSQAGKIHSIDVTSSTVHKDTVLLTYAIDSDHILVPNGVDTFVIDKGRIVLQTVYLGGFAAR